MDQTATQQNPLGREEIPKLLSGFAVPSIIAMLVSSLYNIVDQVFIGWGVGYLGNAATNVAYPLTTISLAIGLLISAGSASRFSLYLGRGEKEKAAGIAGDAIALSAVLGVAYGVHRAQPDGPAVVILPSSLRRLNQNLTVSVQHPASAQTAVGV